MLDDDDDCHVERFTTNNYLELSTGDDDALPSSPSPSPPIVESADMGRFAAADDDREDESSSSSSEPASPSVLSRADRRLSPRRFVVDLVSSSFVCAFGWLSPLFFFGGGVPRDRPIPYQTTSAGDVLLDLSLNHPYVEDETVSDVVLFLSCFVAPLLLLSVSGLFRSSASMASLDGHSSVCSFLIAVGVTEFVTECLKLYVGRFRPNFYDMCGFDETTLECAWGGVEDERGGRGRESRMSFPSGHASLSFCSMTTLSLHFLGGRSCGRMKSARGDDDDGGEGPGTVWKRRSLRFLSLTPMLFATFVAASRIADDWHHPSDVVAGAWIGSACSYLSYRLW